LDRGSDAHTDADAGKHADNYTHENAEAEVHSDADSNAGGGRHPEAFTDTLMRFSSTW
jgi:hypothetical protein